MNFSPIRFDDSEISVGQLPYGDDGEEVLKPLREKHNATHVFRREGANSILAVPVASDASLLGEPKTVRLKEHLGLASALVRNALLTYLAGIGRTVLSYDPLKFIARHDLLRVNPPQGIVPPDWLAVRLLYEVAVRPIYFFKQEPFVAAVLDVRTTRLIERSARSAITRASRTASCSHCRIEGRAGITELCVARNGWVVCSSTMSGKRHEPSFG